MEQIISKPYIAFDYESITVGATAVGLTSSKFSSYAAYDLKAFITLESAEIRWRMDGSDPTSTEGHALETGQSLTLEGYQNLSQFKAIRTGTSSGTIRVTYLISR